jgi:pullulanase
MVSYFKGLLEIRKTNSAFRLANTSDVKRQLKFSATTPDLIAYSLDATKQANGVKRLFVIHNSSKKPKIVKLPAKGPWKTLAQGYQARAAGIGKLKTMSTITVAPQSTTVLSSSK